MLWHAREQALYLIDFYGPGCGAGRRESATDSFELGKGKTVAALAFGTEGRLLVMLDEGMHWFDKDHGLHAKPEKNATA